MSNGEHEIRTPKGLRIGNRSVVDGKNTGCRKSITHRLNIKKGEVAHPDGLPLELHE